MGIDAIGIEVKFNVGKSLATHAVYQMSTSEGKALGEDTAFQSFVPGFDPHGHRPIVLSPDMIWLLIAQGFAIHVNEHAEEMRNHFVSHEGKKKLVVRRDGFIKGSLENPWENVFDEFSTHIRREIGKTNHELIVSQFSTTGVIEKAVNEVVLMDSMKAYFKYIVYTRCGIPEVRLEGTHAVRDTGQS